MKVLLVQYKMLGDVLTSTIIADQLKSSHPDCQIHYLVVAHAEALVQSHPSIDHLIKVKAADFERLTYIFSLSRKLKKESYDLCIDAYGKNNSAILCWLVGAPKRIGFKKWFAPLAYTHAVENKPDLSIYKKGKALGSRMLLTKPVVQEVSWHLKPKIYLTPKEIDQGLQWIKEQGLDKDKPLTMVSVLGSDHTKTYPFSQMAELLDAFVAHTQSQILFNYIPSQKADAKEIYLRCKPQTQQHIFIDSFAPSIRDFLKVLQHCTACIGNEGGAINMAKALDIPTFTVFSPWINKSSWNISEDGEKHISVHLKDFKAEWFGDKRASQFKRSALELYQHLNLEMIKKPLHKFISIHFNATSEDR